MPTIRKSIDIKAPVSEVFAYMADPSRLPEVWPSMMEVSNVQLKPGGGHSFDWVYKMVGFRFHGHSETIEFEQNRRFVVKAEKGISTTLRYTFQGRDDTTKVTVETEYEIPGAILSKLAEPFVHKINEREAETVMANVKARLEEGNLPMRPEAQPHA